MQLPGFKSLSQPFRSPTHAEFTPQRYAPNPRTWQTAARHDVAVKADLQQAYKSTPYSQYIQDFITSGGSTEGNYSDDQIEGAYRASVYLFSAIRRVANLFSSLPIIGEVRKQGQWIELPDSHLLNRLAGAFTPRMLYELYITYALHGEVLIYKRQTLKAKLASTTGRPISKFTDGAVSGFNLLLRSDWELREDPYTNVVHGFDLYVPNAEIGGGVHMFSPQQVVYWHDYDPRYRNRATSMASLAINNAVTNAAIARWAAHYFMSGALPMLMVTPSEEDPAHYTEVDLIRHKNRFEQLWRGVFGKFTARAAFFDRKFNVQDVGVTADKVTAPELNREALNAIASVIQIAPDLIVPPESGSDNARHKHLILQAYVDAVVPVGGHFLSAVNDSLGLGDEAGLRLVIDEKNIRAFDVERQSRSETELSIFQGGAQDLGTTQERLGIEQTKPLANFVMVNGRFQSVERILRDDKIISPDLLQHLGTAWAEGAIKRNEYRRLLGELPSDEPDGYKYELVPDPSAPPPQGGQPQASPLALPPPKVETSAEGTETEALGEAPKMNGTDAVTAATNPNPSPNGSPPPTPPAKPEKTALESSPQAAIQEGEQSTEVEEKQPEKFSPPESESQPAYISLRIGEDSLIQTVAAQLKAKLAGTVDEKQLSRVHWVAPELWHCTLAHTPDCSDDALGRVADLLPGNWRGISLRIDSVQTFQTSEGLQAITLRIEPDIPLMALQSRVRTALSVEQVKPSYFSQAEQYKPHITLAYVSGGVPIPDLETQAIVAPNAITVGRDNYQMVRVIEVADADKDGHPDTANALESRETYARITETRRRLLRAQMRHWNATSDIPGNLPKVLVEEVQEAMDSGIPGDILEATMEAINDGYFDDHTVFIENPVLRNLKRKHEKKQGKQEAVQPNAKEELRSWRAFAMKRGTAKSDIPSGDIAPRDGATFKVSRLPLAIELQVRERLKAVENKRDIHVVFDEAGQDLAETTAVPETAEDGLVAWAERLKESGDEDLLALLDDEPEESGN